MLAIFLICERVLEIEVHQDIQTILFQSYYLLQMGCCCSPQAAEADQYLEESQDKKLKRINPNHDLHLVNLEDSKTSQPESVQKDGEKLKLLGNESFKNKNYTQAIKYYQQAIATPKPDITYYSNLALAFKANSQYKQSVEAINQMIKNPKFSDLKVSPLFAKGKLIKARSTMIIVKSYCLEGKYSQKSNHEHLLLINQAIEIMQDIPNDPIIASQYQQYLQTGQKLKLFMMNEVIPKSKSQDILHYLTRKFNNQGQYTLEQNGQQLGKYFKNKGEIIQQLTSIIQALKATAVQEQKQYLIDPITYEYLSRAVIVPSGTTYNQQTLKQHFKNNGYNDPITHQVFQVGEKVVVRNNNLQVFATQQKKAVSKDDLQFLKY